jgi:O-acetyl-ADP-ribose deacetylase (regulator of RNase III)
MPAEGVMEVVVGDITRLDVDAVVNAANATLLGGGGVDGAIHRAAGPGLLAECRGLGGCPTGDCRITAGHDLKARHVIHCVGPVWHGGARGEDAHLAGCYARALAIAAAHELGSLAFPAISTGAYGFPAERAARIAVETLAAGLPAAPSVQRVVFACFSEASADLHRRSLADLRRR